MKIFFQVMLNAVLKSSGKMISADVRANVKQHKTKELAVAIL